MDGRLIFQELCRILISARLPRSTLLGRGQDNWPDWQSISLEWTRLHLRPNSECSYLL